MDSIYKLGINQYIHQIYMLVIHMKEQLYKNKLSFVLIHTRL
nr:MAG TPA: hypothetical protein [Caudoviricetes sp.]